VSPLVPLSSPIPPGSWIGAGSFGMSYVAQNIARTPGGDGQRYTIIPLAAQPVDDLTMQARAEAIGATYAGLLMQAVDLYRLTVGRNGFMAGILATMAHGFLGLPLSWQGDPEMVAALMDVRDHGGNVLTPGDFARMHPENECAKIFEDGIGIGIGIGQYLLMCWRCDGIEWNRSTVGDDGPEVETCKRCGASRADRPLGTRELYQLRWRDPRWLWRNTYTRQWYYTGLQGMIPINFGDGEWFSFQTVPDQDMWIHGPWALGTEAAIFTRDARYDLQAISAQCGPTHVFEFSDDGSDPRVRADTQEQAKNLRFQNQLFLPGKVKHTIDAAQGGEGGYVGTADRITTWARTEWEVYVTGIAQGTENGQGFANNGVLQRVSRERRAFYAGAWIRQVCEKGLVWWARGNYGARPCPVGHYDTRSPEDKLAASKADTEEGAALTALHDGLDAVGYELDPGYIEERAQAKGYRVRATTKAPQRLTWDPKTQASFVTIEQAIADRGLPPLPPGDPRASMMVAASMHPGGDATPAGAVAAPQLQAAQPSPDARPAPPLEEDDEDDPDEDARRAARAAAMNQHAAVACRHRLTQACPRCGVRGDWMPRQGGGWAVTWAPIRRGTSPVASRARVDDGGHDHGEDGRFVGKDGLDIAETHAVSKRAKADTSARRAEDSEKKAKDAEHEAQEARNEYGAARYDYEVAHANAQVTRRDLENAKKTHADSRDAHEQDRSDQRRTELVAAGKNLSVAKQFNSDAERRERNTGKLVAQRNRYQLATAEEAEKTDADRSSHRAEADKLEEHAKAAEQHVNDIKEYHKIASLDPSARDTALAQRADASQRNKDDAEARAVHGGEDAQVEYRQAHKTDRFWQGARDYHRRQGRARLGTAPPAALEIAEAQLDAALEVLDALDEQAAAEGDDDARARLAARGAAIRGPDGRFMGSEGGGAKPTHDEQGRAIVGSVGTKDGLGRSKAAGIARKGSDTAKAATEAAKGGGSHAAATKAHQDAAAQHRAAAAASVRPDYKAAHEQAAQAHEAVAAAHMQEHQAAQALAAEHQKGSEYDRKTGDLNFEIAGLEEQRQRHEDNDNLKRAWAMEPKIQAAKDRLAEHLASAQRAPVATAPEVPAHLKRIYPDVPDHVLAKYHDADQKASAALRAHEAADDAVIKAVGRGASREEKNALRAKRDEAEKAADEAVEKRDALSPHEYKPDPKAPEAVAAKAPHERAGEVAKDIHERGIAAVHDAAKAVTKPQEAKALDVALGKEAKNHEGDNRAILEEAAGWMHYHANITGAGAQGRSVDPSDVADRASQEQSIKILHDRIIGSK
jgi:hypothetical protein